MISGFNASVSGLEAAARRVRAVAENVANVESGATDEAVPRVTAPERARPAGPRGYSGYRPIRIEQTATEDGGTRAVARPVAPPFVKRFDPGSSDADKNGTVKRPNVALDVQMTELVRAQNAYEANLKAVKTLEDMMGALLDATA